MTRTSKYIAVGMVLIVAVIAGAGFLEHRSLMQDKPTGTGFAQANVNSQNAARTAFHMPSSADKVSMAVTIIRANDVAESRLIKITLHIAKGWHVNANPASLPFLIPTTVRMQIAGKTIPLVVRYPAGLDSGIRLDGKRVMVYDDNAVLAARVKEGESQILTSARNMTVFVTVQSCSGKGICLPPATLKETKHVKG